MVLAALTSPSRKVAKAFPLAELPGRPVICGMNAEDRDALPAATLTLHDGSGSQHHKGSGRAVGQRHAFNHLPLDYLSCR